MPGKHHGAMPHECLDVTFDNDLCRLRTGHGPQNLAMARHIAINLPRKTRKKSSLEVRRKKPSCSADDLGDIQHGQG